MTDEEFDQMIRDVVAMADAHPEMKTVAMGPDLIAEFEKRGITLSSLRPSYRDPRWPYRPGS